MTDIVLRGVKASALTHAEMDANFESLAGTVEAKTANYTVLVGDQNKILEFNGSSLTATLPTVASADGTDTDSFQITIRNINSTDLTIDGNGSETIDGAATLTLRTRDTAILSLNSAGTAWEALINTAKYPELAGDNAFSGTQSWFKGADVASATALSLGEGNIFDVTGTTTIESIATKGVGTTIILQFDGVLQLTHNATSLILPGGNNITTIAGDVLCFTEYSVGNWRLVSNSSTALFALTANNLSDLASASTARTNLGLGALATLDTVNQSLIDTNAIGQAEIKLTNQDVSVTGGSGQTASSLLVAPNYTYRGLYTWGSGGSSGMTASFIEGTGGTAGSQQSITYLQVTGNNNGVTQTDYARCYYVNSSPPYVSADGEILLFMFGIVDNGTGFLESVATSIDPPWMYNGSTKTVADVKGENGEYFIRKRLIDVEIPNWREMQVTGSLSNRRMISRRLKQDGSVYVPIDQSIKNADMNEVPHPFVNVPAGKTVVYLDPVSPVMQDLYEHHILARNDSSAPAASALLHDGYIVIDPQSDLNRDKPNGLKCVSLRWK